MLDIAVSYGLFASGYGGARESLLTLLEGISDRRDVFVTAYQPGPADNPPERTFDYQIHTTNIVSFPKLTWADRVVTRAQWKRYLRRELRPTHDILITQTDLAPPSIEVANEKGIPSIYLVRSLVLTGYDKYFPKEGHIRSFAKTDIGGKIQYPFLWKNFEQHRTATRTATASVANSEFTARKLQTLFDTKVHREAIYPPIELDQYRVEYCPDGYITMVNPRTEYKGPDIFLDIASKRPDEKFLMVGHIHSKSIKKQVEQAENVTHWEWIDDIREAYAESKLVVVPSRFEEPFGRVPAESMVSGIPCVVSDRGGLPDVVGETGTVVSDIDSVDAWISAIDMTLANHQPKDQQQRAQMFSTDRQVEKLDRLLNNIQET